MWVDVDLVDPIIRRYGVTVTVAMLDSGERDRVASQVAWFACNAGRCAKASSPPSGWSEFFQSLLDGYVRVTIRAAEFDDLDQQEKKAVMEGVMRSLVRVNTLHASLARYARMFGGAASQAAPCSIRIF